MSNLFDLDLKVSSEPAKKDFSAKDWYSNPRNGCPDPPETSHIQAACSVVPPCPMK